MKLLSFQWHALTLNYHEKQFWRLEPPFKKYINSLEEECFSPEEECDEECLPTIE